MQVVEARGNIVGVMSDQFCHAIRSSVYWSMSTGPKRRRRGAPIQFNSRRTTSIMLSRHCHLTAGDPMHTLSILHTHRRLFAPANMNISPRLRPREHRPAEHAHSHRVRVPIYDIFTTRSIAQRRYLYLGQTLSAGLQVTFGICAKTTIRFIQTRRGENPTLARPAAPLAAPAIGCTFYRTSTPSTECHRYSIL